MSSLNEVGSEHSDPLGSLALRPVPRQQPADPAQAVHVVDVAGQGGYDARRHPRVRRGEAGAQPGLGLDPALPVRVESEEGPGDGAGSGRLAH